MKLKALGASSPNALLSPVSSGRRVPSLRNPHGIETKHKEHTCDLVLVYMLQRIDADPRALKKMPG